MKGLLLALSRWQVKGRNQVPSSGPLIIVANHIGFIDPPLLTASIPRRIIFMAKEEFFGSILKRAFFLAVGDFPVRRGYADRKALRQATRVLEQGLALGMFPEGTRSPTAQLQSAYAGSALIALRSGAPILPVGISGTEKVKGMAWALSRPNITVSIGQPFHLPAVEGRLTSERLNSLTDFIMRYIAQLLPESYRGAYKEENEGAKSLKSFSEVSGD